MTADLAAARKGDSGAFERLVAPFQRELLGQAYRVTGSLHDAEDVVQDALLRAWQGLAAFEERSSIRTWLHTIAMRAALSFLETRKSRALPASLSPALDPSKDPGPPILEPLWLEPFPDPGESAASRETIALAFVEALQKLPAKQRVALLSHDVIGLSAEEVAELLETSVAAVNSLLQRAREQVPARKPPAAIDAAQKELLSRYLRAWESADLATLKSVLRDDARLSMPPLPGWYAGANAIVETLARMVFGDGKRFRAVLTEANGLPAIASYEKDGRDWVPQSIHALSIENGKIVEITAFLDPSLHARFGLPRML